MSRGYFPGITYNEKTLYWRYDKKNKKYSLEHDGSFGDLRKIYVALNRIPVNVKLTENKIEVTPSNVKKYTFIADEAKEKASASPKGRPRAPSVAFTESTKIPRTTSTSSSAKEKLKNENEHSNKIDRTTSSSSTEDNSEKESNPFTYSSLTNTKEGNTTSYDLLASNLEKKKSPEAYQLLHSQELVKTISHGELQEECLKLKKKIKETLEKMIDNYIAPECEIVLKKRKKGQSKTKKTGSKSEKRSSRQDPVAVLQSMLFESLSCLCEGSSTYIKESPPPEYFELEEEINIQEDSFYSLPLKVFALEDFRSESEPREDALGSESVDMIQAIYEARDASKILPSVLSRLKDHHGEKFNNYNSLHKKLIELLKKHHALYSDFQEQVNNAGSDYPKTKGNYIPLSDIFRPYVLIDDEHAAFLSQSICEILIKYYHLQAAKVEKPQSTKLGKMKIKLTKSFFSSQKNKSTKAAPASDSPATYNKDIYSIPNEYSEDDSDHNLFVKIDSELHEKLLEIIEPQLDNAESVNDKGVLTVVTKALITCMNEPSEADLKPGSSPKQS